MAVSRLDMDVVSSLRDIMGSDFALLINTFISDAPQRIAEMHAMIARNTPKDLEKPAHTLKGSSGNLGAQQLSQFCADLVAQARAGAVSDPMGSVKKIEQELDQVIQLLRTELTKS